MRDMAGKRISASGRLRLRHQSIGSICWRLLLLESSNGRRAASLCLLRNYALERSKAGREPAPVWLVAASQTGEQEASGSADNRWLRAGRQLNGRSERPN